MKRLPRCAGCSLIKREHGMRNRYKLVKPRSKAAQIHAFQAVVA